MSKYNKYIICILITLFIGIPGLNTGVFWDNITFISQMGNALYENGVFHWGSIPIEHDPGHPPFMASIMAIMWKLFGKSLLVSHIILWPFVFGILCQLYNLCSYYLESNRLKCFAVVFIVLDTTFLSHISSIDIEIPQLFFTLLVVNNILYHKNKALKCFYLILLSLVSMRGMMLCFGIFIVDSILYYSYNRKTTEFFKDNILIYVLAAIPSIIYIAWRLLDKGWLISNPYEMWGNSTSFDSVYDFIRNTCWNLLVVGHRYVDFGRIIPILLIIYTFFFKREIFTQKLKNLLVISFFSVSVVIAVSLVIKNNIDHRYFIISFIALNLLAFILVSHYKHRVMLYTMLFVSLLSGSFYVYPDRIAEQWDSTMAYYPYWKLRSQALTYMEEQHIPIERTATFFPNHSVDEVELNNDKRTFQTFDSNNDYVFFSNVLVMYDDEYYSVMNDYVLVKQFKKMGIRVEIRKRK